MASAAVAGTTLSQSTTQYRTSLYTTTPTVSAIRRKPKITYQSPSSYYIPPSLHIEGPAQSFSRALALKAGSISSSSDSGSATRKKRRTVKKTEDGRVEKKKSIAERPKYPMGPPLPLYHPLGRLALSLPELDPATLGLPPLAIDSSRRSSARTRRPAAKLRDADDEDPASAPALISNSVETKDKASPKKKGGARPGAGVKRKRKEADEDATYPAKKTRNPRGGPTALARVSTSEGPSPPDIPLPLPTPEPIVETPEEKRPERRSTRARGSLLRRGSSASVATATSLSTSVAVNIGAAVNGRTSGDDAMEVESPTDAVMKQESGGSGDDKGEAHDKDDETVAEEVETEA